MLNTLDETNRLDSLAQTYAEETGQWCKDIISPATWYVLQHYDLGKRVLLMGIGDGVILEGLRALPQLDITVIEGSLALVDQYPSSANMQVLQSLFEDYKPDQPFDTIIGTHVLEHVADPIDIARVVKGWVHTDSRIIFTVPNADSLHRRIGVEMGLLKQREELNSQDIALGHRRVYRIETLRQDLEHAGLWVQDIRGYILKVMSNAQMAHLSLEFLKASLKVSLGMAPEYCSSLFAVCKNPDAPPKA